MAQENQNRYGTGGLNSPERTSTERGERTDSGFGATGSAGDMNRAGAANTPGFGERSAGTTGMDTTRAMDEARDSASEAANRVGEAAESARTEAERMMKDRAGEVVDEARSRGNDAMDRAAGRIEGAADRIDQLAEQHGSGSGARAKAGEYAHQAADSLNTTAEYLRQNDVSAVQDDLERMTRERPLQMLLGAVAVGWLAGKILK